MMRIESAMPGFASRIAALQARTWRAAHSKLIPRAVLDALPDSLWEASWLESIRSNGPEVLVAIEEEVSLGFIAFGPSRDHDDSMTTGEIWAFYVAPEMWSRGIGKALCSVVVEHFRSAESGQLEVWVLEGNMGGLRSYEVMGFSLADQDHREIEFVGCPPREFPGRWDVVATGSSLRAATHFSHGSSDVQHSLRR